MEQDFLDIYKHLPKDGMPIKESTTNELAPFVERIKTIEEATACIRALLNRYPEDYLLSAAFQRFFELRQTRRLTAWEREMNVLLDMLRRNGHVVWERLAYEKVRTFCPASEVTFWGKNHPVPVIPGQQ